jgi:hypothetical protein
MVVVEWKESLNIWFQRYRERILHSQVESFAEAAAPIDQTTAACEEKQGKRTDTDAHDATWIETRDAWLIRAPSKS